jgi:hypothetical protein
MIPHVVPIGRVENGNTGGKAITTDKYSFSAVVGLNALWKTLKTVTPPSLPIVAQSDKHDGGRGSEDSDFISSRGLGKRKSVSLDGEDDERPTHPKKQAVDQLCLFRGDRVEAVEHPRSQQ